MKESGDRRATRLHGQPGRWNRMCESFTADWSGGRCFQGQSWWMVLKMCWDFMLQLWNSLASLKDTHIFSWHQFEEGSQLEISPVLFHPQMLPGPLRFSNSLWFELFICLVTHTTRKSIFSFFSILKFPSPLRKIHFWIVQCSRICCLLCH